MQKHLFHLIWNGMGDMGQMEEKWHKKLIIQGLEKKQVEG